MHVTRRGRQDARRQEYPAINAHAACVVDFSKAMLEGREPERVGHRRAASVELTEAMAKSAWDGVQVNLPG